MKQQRGGTLMGVIIGIVAGLGVALAVAVYVTKVPIPFVSKAPVRSVEQDVQESQKNKDWDPNAPLYGKNPVRPIVPETPIEPLVPAPAMAEIPAPAVVGSRPPVPTGSSPAAKPAVSADPLGDLVRARSASAGASINGNTGVEPSIYFVQVGAYRTAQDAESQRARLSLGGIEARVSEREQSGRAVFRVRVGPFDKKDEADRTKEKIDAAGLETALVRVQR